MVVLHGLGAYSTQRGGEAKSPSTLHEVRMSFAQPHGCELRELRMLVREPTACNSAPVEYIVSGLRTFFQA